MSEEQLAALLAKLKVDGALQEKLKGASDLDAVVAIAKEAGFDVIKDECLKHQAKQTTELSDEELEDVAGGVGKFFRDDGRERWTPAPGCDRYANGVWDMLGGGRVG